jgi:hypothetical protein
LTARGVDHTMLPVRRQIGAVGGLEVGRGSRRVTGSEWVEPRSREVTGVVEAGDPSTGPNR